MGTGIPLSDRFKGLDSMKALTLEREFGRPLRQESAKSDSLDACTLQITIDGKSILPGHRGKRAKKNTAATCLHKLFSKKLQVGKSDAKKDGGGNNQKPWATAQRPQKDAAPLKGKDIKGKPAAPGAPQPPGRTVPKNARSKDPRLLYGNGSYSMAAKKNANVNATKVIIEQPTTKTIGDSPVKISDQITEKRTGYASNVVKKTQLFGYVAHNVEKQKAVSIGGVSTSRTPMPTPGILPKPLKGILKKPGAAKDVLGPTGEKCPLNQRLDRSNVREANNDKNVTSSLNGSVQEVRRLAKGSAINISASTSSLSSGPGLTLPPKLDSPIKETDSAKTTGGDGASNASQLVKTDLSIVKPSAKKESGPAPIVLKLSIIPSINDGKLNLKLEEEQVGTSDEKGSPSSQMETGGSVVLGGGFSHLTKSTTVTVTEKQLQTGSPVTIVLGSSSTENSENAEDVSEEQSSKDIFAGTSQKIHLPESEQDVSGESEIPASPSQVLSDLEASAGEHKEINILPDSYMEKMSTSEGPVLWPPLPVTKRPSVSIPLPVQENTILNGSPPKGKADHEKTQPASKLPFQALFRKEVSVKSDAPVCAEPMSTEQRASTSGSQKDNNLDKVDMDVSSSPGPSNLHPNMKDVKEPSISNGSLSETAQDNNVPCGELEAKQPETPKKEEVYAIEVIGKSTSPLDVHALRKNLNKSSNSREEKVYPIEVIAKSRRTLKKPDGFHEQFDSNVDKSVQEAIGVQNKTVETENLMDQPEKWTTFLMDDTNSPLKGAFGSQQSFKEAIVDFSKGQNDLPGGSSLLANEPFANIGKDHVEDDSLLKETPTYGPENKPPDNPSITKDIPKTVLQTNQLEGTALELNVSPEGKNTEGIMNNEGSPGTPVADEKSSENSQEMIESMEKMCKQAEEVSASLENLPKPAEEMSESLENLRKQTELSESLENLRKRAEAFATTPKSEVSNPVCLEENNNSIDKSIVQSDRLVPRDGVGDGTQALASKPKDNMILYLRELSCLSDISSEEEWLYSGQDQNQQPLEPLLIRGTGNQMSNVGNHDSRYGDARNRSNEQTSSRSNSLDNHSRSRSNSLDRDAESPYFRGNRGRDDFFERREHLPPQPMQRKEQYENGGYPGPNRPGNMPERNRYDDTETAPVSTHPYMESQVPPRQEAEGAELQQMTAVQALRLQINAAVNPAHRTALLMALQALLCPQPGNNIENIGLPAPAPKQTPSPVIPDRPFDPVLDRHASSSPDIGGQEHDDRMTMDRRMDESDLDRKVEFTVTLNEKETEKLLRKNITKRIADEDDARVRPSPENEMPHKYHGEGGHYEHDPRERRSPEDGLPPMYVERSGFYGSYEANSGGPYPRYHDETRSVESYKSSDTKTTEEIDARDFCSGERDFRQEEMNEQSGQFHGARQAHSPPVRESVKNKKSKRKTKQFHGHPLIKDKSNKTDPIPIPLHISSEIAVAGDPRRSVSPDVEPFPAILQPLEWMSIAETSEKPPKSKTKKHKHKKHKKSGKKKMKKAGEDTAKKEQLETLEAFDENYSEHPTDSDRPPWHLKGIEDIEADPENKKKRSDLKLARMQQIDVFLRQARQKSSPSKQAVNEGLKTDSLAASDSALQHCMSQPEEPNGANLKSSEFHSPVGNDNLGEAAVHKKRKKAPKVKKRSKSLDDCRGSESPKKETIRKPSVSPTHLDTRRKDISEDSERLTWKDGMDSWKAKKIEASSDSPRPTELNGSPRTCSAEPTREEFRSPSHVSPRIPGERKSDNEIQSPCAERYQERHDFPKSYTDSAKPIENNIPETPESPSYLEKGKSTSDNKDWGGQPDIRVEGSSTHESDVPMRMYQNRSPDSFLRHTAEMPCRLSPSPSPSPTRRQYERESRSRSPTKRNYSTDDQSPYSVDSRHSSPERIRNRSNDRQRKFREQKRPYSDIDLDNRERTRSPSPKKYRKHRDRSLSDERHRSKKRHYSDSDSDREDSIKPFSKIRKFNTYPRPRIFDWRQNRGHFNRERSRTPLSRFNSRGGGHRFHSNQGKFFGDHRGRGRGWGHRGFVDRGRGGFRGRGDFRGGKQFFDRSPSMRRPMNDWRRDIEESPRKSMKDLGFESIVPWDDISSSVKEVKSQLQRLEKAEKDITKATSGELVPSLIKARDNIASALKCIKEETHKMDSVGKHQMYIHRRKYQTLMADTRIHTEFLIRSLPKEEKDTILSGFADNATGISDIDTFVEGKVLRALRIMSLKTMIIPCKEILIDKMRKMRFAAMGPSTGSRPFNRRFNRNIERVQSDRYRNGSDSDISPDSTRPDIDPKTPTTPEIASCPENGVTTPSSPPKIPTRMAVSESRLGKEAGKTLRKEKIDSEDFKSPPQLVRRLLSSEEKTSVIDKRMARNSADQVVFDDSDACSSTSDSRTKDRSSRVHSKDGTDGSDAGSDSATDRRSNLDGKARRRSGPDAAVDHDQDQVFVRSGSLRGSKDTGNASSSAPSGHLPHIFTWNKTQKKLHSPGDIETLSTRLRSPLSSPDAVLLSEQNNQGPADQETSCAPVMNASGTMTFSTSISPKKTAPFLGKAEYALDYSTRVKRLAFQTQMNHESEMGVLKVLEREKEKAIKKAKSPGSVQQASSSLLSGQSIRKSQPSLIKPRKKFFTLGSPPPKKSPGLTGKKTVSKLKSPSFLKTKVSSVSPILEKSPSGKQGSPVENVPGVAQGGGTVVSSCDSTVDSTSIPNGNKLS